MEWTARQDLKHRVWALRRSVERYLQLQQAQIGSVVAQPPGATGYTDNQQKLNSEADSQIETVLNDANNLRRTLGSKYLPSPATWTGFLDPLEPLRHVRNIREHWDENRRFWSEGEPPPRYKSARWFKAHFPDKTPWSSSWSNVDGAVICGIIRINELLLMLDQLDELIN